MAVSRFLAIDLGDSSMKIAEFASDGHESLRLVNFGHASLGIDASTPEENRISAIAQTLHKLIAEKQFKANRVALTVSSQAVLTRFTKLPVADEVKTRQMVRFEAEQHVPFPMEEVVWDYQVIGERDEAELEVVLVAIKKDIIEGFNRCIEEANLSLEIVDVAPLAIYNAVRYNYASESDVDCTLIVDIGARTTNLIFVESKKVFTRSISTAGNTITQNICQELEVPFAEAEDLKARHGFVGLGGAYEDPDDEMAAKLSKIIRNVMTRLHAEISRSINFYKTQQNGKAPKRILLAGGSSILSYTDHFFKEKMEIEVDYFNPFKNVPVDLPVAELEKIAHSMGEVVGSGLRLITECPIEINLLPPTVIKKRQFIKKIPFFVASMFGVLFIFLSWWLYYWKITDSLKSHLTQVTEKVSELSTLDANIKNAEGDAHKIHLKAEQIIAVERARYFWVRFFDDLNGRIPQEIWITRLTPLVNGQPVSITGGSAAPATSARRPGRRGFSRTEDTIPPSGGPPETGSDSATKPKTEASVSGISEFEIRGLCLYNWDLGPSKSLKLVTDFRDNLKKSPYFKADNIEIMEPGNPGEDYWTFTFRLKTTLSQPIPF